MRHDTTAVRSDTPNAPNNAATASALRATAATVDFEGWGRFVFAWSDAGLILLGLPNRPAGEHLGQLAARGVVIDSTSEVPEKFRAALRAYVDGDPGPLAALPVDEPGTEFQQRVWSALRTIPAGETRTYGRVARDVGKPGAAHAVGSACSANLAMIAIPCHRVLTQSGRIGGYAGGLKWKQRLLEHEARIASRRG